MKLNPLPLSALTSALLLALQSGAWAQTAPDAGQVLRDLQQAPPAPMPQAAPLQRIDETADLSQKGEARVMVKSVTINGNKEIPTEQLQPLVASLVGAERSLTQLNAAARRITAYYRSQGFAVARAYLPAQDITDGAITISIIEGRISSHKINNQSLLSDERAQAYLGQIKDGDVIKSDQIDRGLLLLQDTPGVSTSRATLQPGASVGTSELLIEVNPAKPYSGNVVLDNYGSRYTGEYRVAGTFNVVSPLKIGDQLTANLLTAGDNLSFARLAYQLPVGSDGLKVGAAYSDIHYKLGKEFEALQAHGTATSASLFAAYPFIRSQFKNLNGTVALEDKRLKDYVDGTNTFTPKKVTTTSFGLSGSLQDALGGGGITGLDLSVILGSLSINSPTALAIDAASARSNGSYTRMTYGLNRLQRFTDSTFLAVSLSGQTASKNLDSSEKFSLGGINGVRAYPQGEASGDEGLRGTVELRHNVIPNVQATLFYDWGSVTINRNPFGPAASNSRNLAGVGVGVNAALGPVQLRSSLAWRTDGGLPTSIPASSAKRPTLWMQASVAF
ncbi:Hemolysin activation/secretion protein [Polaromonas sp. YR568]|uniref:ShlB/FhaC/HecB family hemolysin secretion/activation protein n=1 Tax=Polaromonas sp. YR568 TaxID=1855301 RepID=UPI0008E1B165|nr:ShlB/FhaC/HecB family hemolysin secretion/activation protein [Polaromonas sp. YR568]SFU51903.1 Hemolysin activation/secretion protein [Polaromonas sp. YR568]